ncbi:MAG: aldose epimerase family protein [Verrucomicrobiota bacterium]
MSNQTFKAYLIFLGVGITALFLTGCQINNGAASGSVSRKDFGKTADGQTVEIFTLRNAKGMEAQIMTYGGIVTSLKVPDRNGKLDDVVLGYDNLGPYLTNNPYFGALIGRYGNRIANGMFTLDGHTYSLPQNNGPNNLHAGPNGFDRVVWESTKALATDRTASLKLSYLSKDGDQGFPGNLKVTAVYTLTEDNALRVDFSATADKPTVVNLTHHSYFNLAGQGDILNHEVVINADRFTPVDANQIPTGELRPVKGTPFDFTTARKIGERIDDNDEQIHLGAGYDHNWVLNKKPLEMGFVASAYDAGSGRFLEVFATEPGTQFYTGNFLTGMTGKYGQTYPRRSGFCFEPQHFPDSPNKPKFPSTVLRPGQVFKSTLIYKFSVK